MAVRRHASLPYSNTLYRSDSYSGTVVHIWDRSFYINPLNDAVKVFRKRLFLQSLLVPFLIYQLTTHMKLATDLYAVIEPTNLNLLPFTPSLIKADKGRLDREVHGTLRYPCTIISGGVYYCTKSLLIQVRV